mgnify:CR=1 FL=1
MIESGYYPEGTEFSSRAPWNQEDIPEKEFNVFCSQTLSKTSTVQTNRYIPVREREYDDAMGWHMEETEDTSDTDWAEIYHENEHYTPIQLINLFRRILADMLLGTTHSTSYIEHLIEECSDWTEDDVEYIKE